VQFKYLLGGRRKEIKLITSFEEGARETTFEYFQRKYNNKEEI
jgi:hypothetical protein